MVGFGSAHTRAIVVIVLSLAFGAAACGGGSSEAKGADDEQESEMTGESGFGGEELPPEEDVEPADHDIEVPPAP
jgi:hypothetical protein